MGTLVLVDKQLLAAPENKQEQAIDPDTGGVVVGKILDVSDPAHAVLILRQ